MVTDTRQKNQGWRCADADGTVSYEQATLATLMDIRDELQALRRLAECHRIPRALDAVDRIDRRMQANGVLVGKASR